MKWGMITAMVLSTLFFPQIYAQEKIGFQDVERIEMYYFQPLEVDFGLAIFNSSAEAFSITKRGTLTSESIYSKSFKFNQTQKDEWVTILKETTVFENITLKGRRDPISFRVKENDEYIFFIYPTLFVGEYRLQSQRGPNETFDLGHEIYKFRRALLDNVSAHLRSGTVASQLKFTPQIITIVSLDNITKSKVDLYKKTLGVEYYKESKIELEEQKELYVFKDTSPHIFDRVVLLCACSISKDDLILVFNLIGYIHLYENKQLAKIEDVITDHSKRLANFEAVISSYNLTLINETQNDLKESRSEYLSVEEVIDQLKILSEVEERLFQENNYYFRIYREEIENHNNFFKRDVKDLEIRNRNIINDYRSLSVQLQSRAEFLVQMQKMDEQIKWAIRGVWVAAIAAILAAIGLFLTWRNGGTQTPIFEKIKEYLKDLRSQKKNNQ